MEKFNFQFCPKIVVFSKDLGSVLLCRRKGENDYDGVFSFIGGKMEITDRSILDGLVREKCEEVGVDFKVKVNTKYSSNLLFEKKDGSKMILPHYYAIHESGNVVLSEEYSEFVWVPIDNLETFEPKIETVPSMVAHMLDLMKFQKEEEFMMI